MLNYSETNDYHNICLHDCAADDIFQENEDVIFEFNNGFWIRETNEQNQYRKTLCTDKSQLRLTNVNLEASDIYMFKHIRLFGIHISTVRIKIKFPIFCARINRGDWQFIFKDEAYDDIRAVFDGYIYSKLKQRYRKCQIILENEGTLYSWSESCMDKPG